LKTKLEKLKQQRKHQAAKIRTMKDRRKTEPNGHVDGLFENQWLYRVWHIIYCQLRGRSINEIENNRLENPPALDDQGTPIDWWERELRRDVEKYGREFTGKNFQFGQRYHWSQFVEGEDDDVGTETVRVDQGRSDQLSTGRPSRACGGQVVAG